MQEHGDTEDMLIKEFAREVKEGLSADRKKLSSLYFYDDEGSRIFQRIMAMPEYYLTNSEAEIFEKQSTEIYKALNYAAHFKIIELGAGDGEKTEILLRQLIELGADFTYIPIDISEEANRILVKRLTASLPQLKVDARTGDYFDVLRELKVEGSPSLLLFLGSNIGNFPPPMNVETMEMMSDNMQKDDHLLIGIDLKKDPNIIRAAYFDAGGVTKEFNINLLKRINRELGGNFQLPQWDFYSFYEPKSGDVRSFLVSLAAQDVHISALDQTFSFEKNELIWTELSKKYSLSGVKELGAAAGLNHVEHFLDSNQYYSDTLFIKK